MRYPWLFLCALAALPAGAAPRPAPAVPKTGLYGPPAGTPSRSIPVARPPADDAGWQKAPFAFLQTELSPATLYHTTTGTLGFFTHLQDAGLGGPTFAAYATKAGPRVFRPGEPMRPAEMSECWVLVWFAGAEGWQDWDSPWVVYLQRRPKAMALDATGLWCDFAGAGGYAVLLPLYGYYKPPQQGHDFLAEHGLPSKGVRPWEWAKGLPADVLARIRYWAKVSREFPTYCRDTFSVDRSKDTVTIRQQFRWLSIEDDWKTPHLKLAPVSPPLAQAARDPQFPVSFSKPLKDPYYFTPYGPYMGVEGADGYDAVFPVLKYVNETEAYDPPDEKADPSVPVALKKLRDTMRGKFRSPDRYDYDHGGMDNFCWAIQGDEWYARALPYCDEETRKTAIASLGKYFRDDVLAPARFKEREYPKGSGINYLILEGPGIGSWGVLGDAGKFSSNMLETLWAYGQYTGDWALIKERWPLIKRLFCTPGETRWATFGREAIAEMGDEAAPCLALARMAYRVGDLDTYDYGCYMFARELVHHWLKQRGAQYFRLYQPWHSMEFMPEEVYLTNFWGDTASWQIDGPTYPAKTGERQYNNRWVRFKNPDVGRFYRDYLKADVRKELDLLQGRWDPKRCYVNDSHIMPSMVQLRSLLLNETPAELAKVAAPEKFGGVASGVIGSCIGLLRTSHPTRYERLIPAGAPTPFVAGLERQVPGANPYLAQAVISSAKDAAKKDVPQWPQVTWWGWKAPKSDRWSFGEVLPSRTGAPADQKKTSLNWNTLAVSYSVAP